MNPPLSSIPARFWAPWGLLAAGAAISMIPSLPEFAHQGAAYLIAAALAAMAFGIARRAILH